MFDQKHVKKAERREQPTWNEKNVWIRGREGSKT